MINAVLFFLIVVGAGVSLHLAFVMVRRYSFRAGQADYAIKILDWAAKHDTDYQRIVLWGVKAVDARIENKEDEGCPS